MTKLVGECPRCSAEWSTCPCGKVDIVTGEPRNAELVALPGYRRFVEGGTRGEMEQANREAGRPCYCASLWSGFCDMCTGLAPMNGDRWRAMLREYGQ
jgi:hypothetical protein